MGSFVFRWPHPEAKEVYVTGTFDDWGRTEKLDKIGETFEKEVRLSDASEKILYKFVVDENWTTDHTAPQEDDGHGNINNVLKPEDIKKEGSMATDEASPGGVEAALVSSAHPDSTSAQLAGQVPKETVKPAPTVEETSSTAPPVEKLSAPGAFPETPAEEPESFSVNPIPASEGVSNPVSVPAGDKLPDHEETTQNTVDSRVTTSKEDYEKEASSAPPEEKSYGVNPIPATEGAGNPISVPAGEKLPNHDTITQNNVDSHVTTSKEDYEKDASSALPEEKSFGVNPLPASEGVGNPVSVPAGESIQEHQGFAPESLEANATTSKEDYERAGGAAMPVGAATDDATKLEDSAISVPDRTKDMIPESSLPMSTEAKDTTDVGPFMQSSGPGTTTAALAGQVPLEPKREATVVDDGTPSAPQEEAKDTPEAGPFVQSSGSETTTAALAGQVPLEPKSEAKIVDDKTPAATDKEAKDTSGAGPFMQSSGPETTTAGLAGQVPLEPKSEAKIVEDEPPSATVSGPAPDVPEVVKESLAQAHASPEAAASSTAVEEKRQVENELLNDIKATDAAGEPAPTATTAPVSGTAPDVPEVVQESLAQAHASPEAAASSTAVEEKRGMENELLNNVKATDAAGEPAPTATTAPVSGTAPDVPEVVQESLAQAHASPEAAASSAAVEEKKQVESELLKEVKATDAAGEPAPTASAALSATAPSPTATHSQVTQPAETVEKKPEPSGEISSTGTESTATAPAPSSPVVTTGVADSKTTTVSTPQKETTPASSAGTSPATSHNTTDKKKKRTSLFGKLKEKLKG